MNFESIEQQGFNLVEIVDETSQTIAWKAVQRTLERTVILRILKPMAAADPLAVEHFLSMARIMARIKSESLASIFDIVSTGDLHYVVMEHVEGPTLEELVEANGPLPVERALRIAASLIGCLDLLWDSVQVVHRNLKGGTIRLAMRGVAKITDFSLAIKAGPGVNATALDGGNIVGTPCFLSPEQAQGSHTLTTQSDMYALGVILYYLTTGIVPFEQQDAITILAAHVHQQIPPPHELNPSVPTSFSWFVHRLMMKEPENRYPDWQTVLQDIRFQLAGEPPSCVTPDETEPSTIETFGAKGGVPQLRLKRKPKGQDSAAYQSKYIEEHAYETQRAMLRQELACWFALGLWLTALLWYRAVYQAEPATDADTPPVAEELTSANAEELTPHDSVFIPDRDVAETAPPPVQPPPVAVAPTPAPAPAPTPVAHTQVAPAPLPSGIPAELATSLAKAFADGSIQAAREAAQASDARFKEKEQLAALLERVPDPDSLVADYLRSQIGKPLIFERNGKQRTVIPREIADDVIRFESNGRGIDIPISTLSADERLRWMDRPKDEPQCVAYCVTLMRSSRRSELPLRATGCPLLVTVMAEAATLVTAQ